MRYSEDCMQFFWVGKKLFVGRFIWFMSGLKCEIELLQGRKILDPLDAKINSECPNESILSSF